MLPTALPLTAPAAPLQACNHFLLRPAWLSWLMFWQWGEERRHKQAIRKLQQAVGDIITLAAQHQANTAASSASGPNPGSQQHHGTSFLADMLSKVQQGSMTQAELQQNVLEVVIAGTDTSSVTMFYALVALQDDPALEQRLRQEVAALGGGCRCWACMLGTLDGTF